MCDGETVGGLQVVHIVIEVEGFLRRVLVGVIQLDSKPEGAVLLHCGAHEQPAYRREHVTRIGTLITSFPEHMMNIRFRSRCDLYADWRQCSTHPYSLFYTEVHFKRTPIYKSVALTKPFTADTETRVWVVWFNSLTLPRTRRIPLPLLFRRSELDNELCK